MSEHSKQKPSAISDLDLDAVSGGNGYTWINNTFTPSSYTVGMRVRCTCFSGDHKEGSYIDTVGTIKDIDFLDKCSETLYYLVELDSPDPWGEKRHWIPQERILGPA